MQTPRIGSSFSTQTSVDSAVLIRREKNNNITKSMFTVFFAWCDSIAVDVDGDFSSLQWDESNGGNERKERYRREEKKSTNNKIKGESTRDTMRICFVPHSFSHFRFNMPPLDDALVYCHWRTKQQPPTLHDEHLNGENDALRWHCALRSRPKTRRVERRRYICQFRISWSNLYLNKQAKCITNIRTSEFVECWLCCGDGGHRRCRATPAEWSWIVMGNEATNK